MKNAFKRFLCGFLSILLVFGTGIVAFAQEAEVTPVVVVNDIYKNPIVNTDDNSVVFNFSDYQYDILFTDGFSSDILDLFSKDVIDKIQSGEMSEMDIIMLLSDYLGYSEDLNKIVNKVMEIVMELMANMGSMDIESLLANFSFDTIINGIKDKISEKVSQFKLLKMNDDGTPAYDNIGIISYPESLEYYYDDDIDSAYAMAGDIAQSIAEKIGYENTFVYTYDWRLDPVANADEFNNYIETVKEKTGADKVTVISEGYGSVIATAYLAAYEDAAASSIKNFVTVSSEFLGTSVVGDYFKGDIVDEFTNINSFTSAYIRYTNDLSDNPITAFTTWLVNYILNRNWEVQGFCVNVASILSDFEFFLDNIGITAEFAKMPGVWALVPASDFDDAVTYIYGDNVNQAVYEKAFAYKAYQNDYENILQTAKANGINVSVVAAWDLQILPVGENNSVQSDGIVDTAYASFGATCVEINNVTDAMKAKQAADLKHDHISDSYDMLTPWYSYGGICHYIDASTCALPENTWFIKDMKHGTFDPESNSMNFIIWLVTAEGERTVWDDVAYMQFMQYNRFFNPGILQSNGVSAVEPAPGKYLLGDINLDEKVTSIDSRLALRAAAGLEPIEKDTIQFKNGDVYTDGVINAADARKILLMSAGLVDDMQSGIDFDYVEEQGLLNKSEYELELRPYYDSVKNTLELTVVVKDAIDSYSGNFVIKYDADMLTYSSVDVYDVKDGNVVAGAPAGMDGVLACAYSLTYAVTQENCDENGDMILATFSLDVSRKNVYDTVITAGASYFYENGEMTFVEPVELKLDEEFFLMLGDADNNRYLSAADARLILRIAAQLEKVTDDLMFKRCDVDKDGKITAKDARLVLRASAKLIDSFDEEGTNFEEDLTVKS